MEKNTLVGLGILGAIGAYFLLVKPAAASSTDTGGTGDGPNSNQSALDSLASFLNGGETNPLSEAFKDVKTTDSIPTAGGNNNPSADTKKSFAQSLADTYNTQIGNGAQLVQPNASGSALNLNPSFISGGSFTGAGLQNQATLTQGLIGAGLGIGSLTPQAGGGVALDWTALYAGGSGGGSGGGSLSNSTNPADWKSVMPATKKDVIVVTTPVPKTTVVTTPVTPIYTTPVPTTKKK